MIRFFDALMEWCTNIIYRYAPYILFLLIVISLATIITPYILEPQYYKINYGDLSTPPIALPSK